VDGPISKYENSALSLLFSMEVVAWRRDAAAEERNVGRSTVNYKVNDSFLLFSKYSAT
jgi:hypothetical protein